MIPSFPEFKKLELSDRQEIEKLTSEFPPHSDFNFTSLWAWDTDEKREISKLNGNLVVRFTDYKTQEPFFSFIGLHKPVDTARELIQHAKKFKISPILQLVPAEVASLLNNSDFCVEEDKDNFDYIFLVKDLANFAGSKFKEKRHLATRFLRENSKAIFEIKELQDESVHKNIMLVLEKWKDKKKLNKNIGHHDFQHEEIALKRLLKTSKSHRLIVFYVLLNNTLIGFSIDEILYSGHSISHFVKADTSYNGVYDFLNQKIAQYLLTQKIIYWNWEQDIGMENLKKSKMSHHPVNFLKKYKVSLTSKK